MVTSSQRSVYLLKIITVCTGNICRSPLAAAMIQTSLVGHAVEVVSAGTRSRDGSPMTPEALKLAADRGEPVGRAVVHRSRSLTTRDLNDAHLALAMSREHRREIVELRPAQSRTAFTIREFARLAASVSDEELSAAASATNATPARLSIMLDLLASRRGVVAGTVQAEDDDVVDPYGRSVRTYDLCGKQLDAAVPAVVRVIALALNGATT